MEKQTMVNLPKDPKMLSAECLVNHFCERLNEEQWMLLKSGTPNAASRIQIAELVLGMIKVLTTNVLTAMETMKLHKPEEEVVDAVTEIIADVALQTMSFSDNMDSVASKCLSTLITAEVTESITSSLCATSSPLSSFLELKQDVVNPYRLNAMVTQASNMFKNMKVKMKALFSRPGLSRQGSSRSQGEKEVKESKKSLISKIRTYMESGKSSEIKKMASGIVTPFTDDLNPKEVEDLLCEVGEEAEGLSEDIRAVLSTRTTRRQRRKINSRIKNFFTNCITKVWRCRLLEQLKNRYKPECQPASSPLVESLVDNISSHLKMCAYKSEKQRKKKVYFNTAIEDVNAFIEKLNCKIKNYFTADEATAKVEQLSVAMRRTLVWDLQNKVWIFVALMNWWLTTQANDFSERLMTHRQQVPKKKTKRDPKEGEGGNGASEPITQETLVYHLVENILWQIYQKTHVYFQRSDDIHDRLFQLICSQIEKDDLTLSFQDLNRISEKIYKDLCKKWGNVHNVAVLLNLQNHDLDMCVVSMLRYQLTKPPKKHTSLFRNCIKRMFTCCC